MNHKPNLFAAGTLALLVFAGLTACASMTQGTSSPRTYAAHGVSFHYPRGWSRFPPGPGVGCCRSHELWALAVGPSGGTEVDSVDVTASGAGGVVTRKNLPALTPNVVRQERSQFRRRLHGELIGGPHAVAVGGMPGLRFAGTEKTHGAAGKVTVVLAFNGTTEYAISCSATSATAAAVQQACEQVLRTFKVGKLFSAGAALVYRAHGVTFDYPPSWFEGTEPGVPAGCSRCKSWSAAVALDRLDGVEVIANGHEPRVTRNNRRAFKSFFTRHERRVFRQSGGRLLAGPRAITVGGMPGLLYRGNGNLFGTVGKSTVAVVANGTTDYEIACTATPSKANAVKRACAEVLRTFKVTQP
jgi:hypothetical protein